MKFHGIPTERISRWIYMARCVQEFGQVKNIPAGEERTNRVCADRKNPRASTAWLIECQGSRGSLNYSKGPVRFLFCPTSLTTFTSVARNVREWKEPFPSVEKESTIDLQLRKSFTKISSDA